MQTKIIIAATAAALSLATTAFAAEGNGNPFPFRAGTVQTEAVTGVTADVGAAQLPSFNPALSTTELAQPTLPENGSQGEVASANSLPAGAQVGTLAYAQAERLNVFFSGQAQHAYAMRMIRQASPRS